MKIKNGQVRIGNIFKMTISVAVTISIAFTLNYYTITNYVDQKFKQGHDIAIYLDDNPDTPEPPTASADGDSIVIKQGKKRWVIYFPVPIEDKR